MLQTGVFCESCSLAFLHLFSGNPRLGVNVEGMFREREFPGNENKGGGMGGCPVIPVRVSASSECVEASVYVCLFPTSGRSSFLTRNFCVF